MQKYNFIIIYIIFGEAKCHKEKGGLYIKKSEKPLW